MALYAVFSSPQQYEVYTVDDQPIGSLEQKFIDTLTPEISCFLLGGRSWIAQSIDRDNRKIIVAPAPHGKKPTWGGFIPQFLGWEICQEIAALLKSKTDLVYLDKDAKLVLNTARSERRQEVIDRIIWEEDKQVQWWTFAGGRINRTLKYGLECLWGWEVRADNFQITVTGEHLTAAIFEDAILEVIKPEFWKLKETQKYLLKKLPNYRFSKFQQVLPDRYALEMVQGYLLDIEGITKLM